MYEVTTFAMADVFDLGAVRCHDEYLTDRMPYVFSYAVYHIGKRAQIFVNSRNDDVDDDI